METSSETKTEEGLFMEANLINQPWNNVWDRKETAAGYNVGFSSSEITPFLPNFSLGRLLPREKMCFLETGKALNTVEDF